MLKQSIHAKLKRKTISYENKEEGNHIQQYQTVILCFAQLYTKWI